MFRVSGGPFEPTPPPSYGPEGPGPNVYWTLIRPVFILANSVASPSNGLSGHAQLKIQSESERSLANPQPVPEVKSSLTFSRPE